MFIRRAAIAMNFACVALSSALLSSAAHAAGAAPDQLPFPVVEPAQLGFSPMKLHQLTDHFDQAVRTKVSPGYVIMVARQGKLALVHTVGYRDLEAQTPITLDTRFRIASMTKPVTAAAVMMLVEDGLIQMNDPISRYVPAFADSKVAVGLDENGGIKTEPAKRPITVLDLLTHTSGLGYVFEAKTPLGKLWGEKMLARRRGSLGEMVDLIAGLPLYFQPGERFFYSFADDVLGRLVEVVSQRPFEEFLMARIFGPLRMSHTSFHLNAAQMADVARVYKHSPDGELVRSDPLTGDPTDPDLPSMGGGGLISTAGDYLRFAQMLLNGGELDGRRILSPVSVAQMTASRLDANEMERFWGPQSAGHGYGLGIGDVNNAARATHLALDGDFSWGGLFDTQWFASPKSGIAAVIMTQIDPSGEKEPRRTREDFNNLVYGALMRLPGKP